MKLRCPACGREYERELAPRGLDGRLLCDPPPDGCGSPLVSATSRRGRGAKTKER